MAIINKEEMKSRIEELNVALGKTTSKLIRDLIQEKIDSEQKLLSEYDKNKAEYDKLDKKLKEQIKRHAELKKILGYTGNAASIDSEAVVKAIGEIEGVEGKKGERVLGSKLIEAIGTTKIKFAQWVKKNKVGIKVGKKQGTSNTYSLINK